MKYRRRSLGRWWYVLAAVGVYILARGLMARVPVDKSAQYKVYVLGVDKDYVRFELDGVRYKVARVKFRGVK